MKRPEPSDRHKQLHSQEAIARRLDHGPSSSYLRDLIYGAIDGTVTTFAIVAGVSGADLQTGIVVILGLANLVADGFSMAVSNYLGTRADEDLRHRTRLEEYEHIRVFPEGEREEIRQIFARKGFEGEELERAVDVITADVERWVDTMLQEEYGLALNSPDPKKAALATFVAFSVAGAVPLLPFLWNWLAGSTIDVPFVWSAVASGLAFFVVGSAKGRYVEQRWFAAGSETLLMGGGAALIAYGIGLLLKNLVG